MMLYQLSYEATHWERGQLTEFISSREEGNDVKYICAQLIDLAPNVWLQSSVGRAGIAEVTGSNHVEALIFFKASSFQLHKLEN